MTNSADPDQLASEANCSGSTLFAKTRHDCSAREGLIQFAVYIFLTAQLLLSQSTFISK